MRPASQPMVRALQGRRAGIVSRVAADAIDLVLVVLIAVGISAVAGAVQAVFGGSLELWLPADVRVRGPLALVLLVVYLTYGWGFAGRTIGKSVMGLRVLRTDASELSLSRAFVRALLYAMFPVLLFWAVLSRRNASVQDLVLDTAVIHDWGDVEEIHIRLREPAPGASS